MKKYITTLLVFAVLVGCSDSSDSGVVLPKKITDHLPTGYIVEHHYSYDGNKVISVTETEGTQEFENRQFSYAADKLIRIDNTITGEYIDFHYNSEGSLSEIIEYFPAANYARKLVYNFTSSGFTVGFYQGDLAVQDGYLATDTFTTNGGNITAHDNGNYIFQFSGDNKNNPFKNISNFSIIQSWLATQNTNLFGDMYLNQNNVLTASDGTYVTTRTYTYNSAGYPVSFYVDEFENELRTITY